MTLSAVHESKKEGIACGLLPSVKKERKPCVKQSSLILIKHRNKARKVRRKQLYSLAVQKCLFQPKGSVLMLPCL